MGLFTQRNQNAQLIAELAQDHRIAHPGPTRRASIKVPIWAHTFETAHFCINDALYFT